MNQNAAPTTPNMAGSIFNSESQHIESLEKYKELLRSVCKDGNIPPESNQLLYQKAFTLQISPREAAELRETIINETIGLSCIEKLELEAFDRDFNSGLYDNAYKRIKPILKRHGNDDNVITKYLRVTLRIHPVEAEAFVLALTTDNSDAYLTLAESNLLRGNTEQCGKILDEALAIWPDNKLLLCSKARQLIVQASKKTDESLFIEANEILKKCSDSDDSFTQESIDCAKAMNEYCRTKSKQEFETLNSYWAPFISQLTNEISVSIDGTKAYTSIKDAIDNAPDGAAIHIYPGTYEEQFIIEKNIHIKGIPDENGNNPIICFNPLLSQNAIIDVRSNNCILENIDITKALSPFSVEMVSAQLSAEKLDVSTIGLKVTGDFNTLNNINIYGFSCIGLEIYNCGNISVQNCNFFKNANSGAVIAGNCSGTFRNCFFTENEAFGKQLFGTNEISFKECIDAGNRYGYFTDPRDGETYGTVRIGTQTWMSENLRYRAHNGCRTYGEDEDAIKRNGVYYSWTSMLNISDLISEDQSMVSYSKQLPGIKQTKLKDYWSNFANFINGKKVQGIAPDGWRIPTDGDVKELLSHIQKQDPTGSLGGKFISTEEFQINYQTNSTGFNAFAAGSIDSASNTIDAYGKRAKFWTSCMDISDASFKKASCFSIGSRAADIETVSNRSSDLLNVRCILDDSHTMDSLLNQVEIRERINKLLDLYNAIQEVAKINACDFKDIDDIDETKILAYDEYADFLRHEFSF